MALRAVPDPPVRIGGRADPCPSIQRAVLGAVGSDGVLVRCGLLKGHDGPHEFRLTWHGPGVDLLPIRQPAKGDEQ